MRTVIFSMTMSLDGYVNEPDGSFDWTAPDPELHQFHNDRVRTQTLQLCGRRLYDAMRYWDGEDDGRDAVGREFAEIWRPLPKVVFSSTLTTADLGPNARLATASAADAVRAIDDGVIGVGGATLAAELAREDLIDDYSLFIAPVLVGGGTPLLPAGLAQRLTLAGQRTFAGGVTHLRYLRDRA